MFVSRSVKVGLVCTISGDRRNFIISLLKANTEPSMDEEMMLQLPIFFFSCGTNSIIYYVKILRCLFEFLVLRKPVLLFLIQRSLN